MARTIRAQNIWLLVLVMLFACQKKPAVESDGEMARGTVALGNESFVRHFLMLELDVDAEKGKRCSGVLLGPRHALTAAHCVEDVLKIRAKRFDHQMRSVEVPAAAWQMHPGWKKMKNRVGPEAHKHDLAIVLLESEISEPFVKISVSRSSNIPDAVYVGSGRKDGNIWDGKVRYARNIDAFKLTFRPDGGTWISRGAAMLCSGDSGGPLLAKDGSLLGIAAAVSLEPGGNTDCGAGKRLYHADVQESIVWLVCAFAKTRHPLPGFPVPSLESCQ